MEMLALGFIGGIALATFVAVVLSFFKRPIISMLSTTEKRISNAGPRETGAIFVPESEAEVARKEHIEKNAREGKDTPITELL